MRYKLLGKSGLRVSELCLGTMTFGEDWGWGASKDESRRIFDIFVEAGGNFIDTSNNYTNGTSERFVGEFIAADRERFVVATKYSLTTRGNDPNAGGNHRKNMRQAVEASLKRLNTDYIDLLWLHMWDYTTPIDEVMRSFDDLVQAGKVNYIGFSDTPAWVVAVGDTLAAWRGWSRVVAFQGAYSVLDRGIERDLLPMAKTLDITVLPWGLLEGGVLTGKYSQPSTEPQRYSGASDAEALMADVVGQVAAESGRSPAQVAINWVRQQQHKARIIPILGVRREAQIRDNLACLEWELTPEQMTRLDEAGKFQLGFPHGFLYSAHVKNMLHGETYAVLDNHH